MVFDTSFEKLDSFIKSLGMTREKIMDYWMKQLCWLSNDEKCEKLQKYFQLWNVKPENILQNWIENKQISLLELQEIIQKEEERRKKQALENSLAKKREAFLSKVDFIKLSAKNISQIKAGMFWYACDSVSSTYIPPQMVADWMQELMAVVVFVDTENLIVYGDTVDRIDWKTANFADAQRQVASMHWPRMAIPVKGFKLPQIEMLQKIGDNCKLINPILQKAKLPVFSGDFWSSTLNGNNSQGAYIHLEVGKDCSQTEFLVGYDDIEKEKQARGLLSIKLQ